MTLALLVLAALVVYFVITYNGLTQLRLLVANAWSDIDVQLKRRHDLVPALVTAVKGHAGYERGTVEAVVNARSRALTASGPAAAGPVEGALGGAVRQVLALAESYPDLKAGQSFLELQKALVAIEDHVQNARRYYNAVVRDYNTRQQQFPSSLVAGAMGLKPAGYFTLDSELERAVPGVETGS
jgi:LemA protein